MYIFINMYMELLTINQEAWKRSFGKDYYKLYPGSVYAPSSYNEHFSSMREIFTLFIKIYWGKIIYFE